jgi:hypothetical protein
MGILSVIRTAQSENVEGGAQIEHRRECPCGERYTVIANGQATVGIMPAGLFMSDSDRADGWQAAQRAATRNAQRNARWSRCPKCGRRGTGAHVFAALSRLLVLVPMGVLGAITGCIVGMVRDSISPSTMGTTAMVWAAAFAAPVWIASTWRRLLLSDRSIELQPGA